MSNWEICVITDCKDYVVGKIIPLCNNHTNTFKRYPLDLETFIEMVERKVCDICGKTNSLRYAIDHDHITGLVRGLLCSSCNTGLGQLGDTVEGLQNGLRYLIKHEMRN